MALSLSDGRRGNNQPDILAQIQGLMPSFDGNNNLIEQVIRQRQAKAAASPGAQGLIARSMTQPGYKSIYGRQETFDGSALGDMLNKIANPAEAMAPAAPSNLGAQLGAVIGTTNAPEPTPGDPIMEQLFGLLQQGGGGVDTAAYEAAMSDQAKAIRRGYRGQIRGLREEQDLARERGEENRSETDKMYRALAQQYRKEARRSNRQGQRAADEVTNRAAQSAEVLNESANARNEAMLKRAQELGIEDALGGVLPETTEKDAARAAAIMAEGTRAANREASAGRSGNRALRESGLATRREGADVVSGMQRDEEDFIRGIGQDIAGLRASRASDLASNRAAVAAQLAQLQGSSTQDLFKNYLDLARFQMDRDRTQSEQDIARQRLLMELQGGGAQSMLPKELQTIEQLAGQLNPEVQGIVQDLVSEPDKLGMVKGPAGEAVPMNYAHMTQLMQQEAAARGIQLTDQDMQNALGILLTAGKTVRY